MSTREIIERGESIFHEIRWPNGVIVCPYCGSVHVCVHDGYRYKCNSCKNRFSDRTKTVMHGSKIPTTLWIQAAYEMMTSKYMPSTELSKRLGVSQKTAWLMQTKLRWCMDLESTQLSGDIAQDEMYLGGCLSNYHYGRKLSLLRSRHYIGRDERRYSKSAIYALNSALKTPVFGMNDGNSVILYATPNPVKKEYLHYLHRKHVLSGSITVSDESKLYDKWEETTGSPIYTNNHHNNQYHTSNGLTSNRIENTFSWLSRSIDCNVTHCTYTQLYLNEFCWRYNTRHLNTKQRLQQLINSVIGKTITYQQLRSYDPLTQFPTVPTNRLSSEEIEDILNCGAINSITIGHKTYTKY